MINLLYPFDENQIRSLHAGDTVSITGRIYTGRDRFHKYFADGGEVAVDFNNGALYHCGPVIVPEGDGWRVVAAGPTTSVRENPYEPDFIRKSGVRLIIGKGGMDEATLAAMGECGCVYIQAVGGAAAIAAASVNNVAGVSKLEEFGAAEAVWHFDVSDFRGVVAMDTYGVSLFKQVAETSRKRFTVMRRAFTIMEIMIVVTILGLVASIAIPNFVRYRNQSYRTTCISNLRRIRDACEQSLLQNHKLPGSLEEICGPNNFIKNVLTCPARPDAGYTMPKDEYSDPVCNFGGDEGMPHIIPYPDSKKE